MLNNVYGISIFRQLQYILISSDSYPLSLKQTNIYVIMLLFTYISLRNTTSQDLKIPLNMDISLIFLNK